MPASSEKALEIVDLQKRYPTGVEALRGVSITIEPGDFYGLLGPNGAGKSTLIHCTTGLAQPTGGQIHVFGHDAISDYGEARAAVGLAPQEVNLDQFLTCEETLEFHGGYFGMQKQDRKERTEELLETFSLTAKARERTRALSGGMKRRLILARALMHRPRLLILDEPTAGVDIELRLELWHYVQKINGEGVTILLTGHVQGPIPPRGVVVELLVHYRGKWVPFRDPRTDNHGAFHAEYQFQGSIGTFPFVAEILAGQAGFPYTSGESNTVNVNTR